MSVAIPEELKAAKKALDAGEKPKASVRELLDWFGYRRRRGGAVDQVNQPWTSWGW